MKGGDTTYPLDCPNGMSQAAAIAPAPRNPHRYYVFSLHPQQNVVIDNVYCISGQVSTDACVLKYCMVDMTGDQANGEMSTPVTVLDNDLTEKMAVIAHANGTDYWLVAHEWKTNSFRSYPVSVSGVGTPVITAIGSRHGPNENPDGSLGFGYERTGQLKASPDGKRLAISLPSFEAFNYPLELFDFDNNTGRISNLINLGGVIFQYGLSFSPDNSKLYAQSLSPWFSRPYELILQYDLNAGGSEAIAASRMSIIRGNPRTNINDIAVQAYSPMQLAPDGKLYGLFSASGNPDSRRMFVIANPNAKGFDCNVNAIHFNFPVKGFWAGLPNFMDSYFNNLTPSTVSGDDCSDAQITVFPNPTTKEVRIQLSDCLDSYTLRIFDVAGRLLEERTISQVPSPPVTMTAWAKGLYVFDITSKNKRLKKNGQSS